METGSGTGKGRRNLSVQDWIALRDPCRDEGRRLSLRFALLGLLARESLTGYDLTKRFDSTIGFFWSAKHSQIYPELAALSKEGLVTFEVVTQTSKPNKKVYTITAAGRDALSAWAAEETEKRSVKDPLLMRVWAIGVVPADRVLPHLKSCLAEYDKRLTYMAELKQVFAADPREMAPDQLRLAIGPLLAMRYGELQYTVYRDWLRDAIETLEKLDAPAAKA